jgi:hypothetical protein
MTCVLRCRFYLLAQVFWELCLSVSVEVLMHGKALDLTSSLLGRRNLATLARPGEIRRPSLEEPFLADESLAVINERSAFRDRRLRHCRNCRSRRNRPI